MNRLCRTVVPGPNGAPHPFGSWSAAVVTAGDLDAYRGIVLSKSRGIRGGTVSVNRCLGLLRAMFNWAVLKGYVERTPFKVGTVTAVRMLKETPRHRRLEPGEKERLLAEAGPHLRALIVAALETCCRQGELLSLQLRQVKWERSELHFPADKTKARRERFIPISQRLQALHEMRRHGPDGRVFGPDAYVFGDEIGARVGSIKTAWRATCRRAGIEDLNFHDLRREAGSRLLEGGMPEHYVQRFLDHANLSTTSRYLATTRRGMHQVFRQCPAPQGFLGHLIAREFSQEECRDGEARSGIGGGGSPSGDRSGRRARSWGSVFGRAQARDGAASAARGGS